jgi:hypothetical protein
MSVRTLWRQLRQPTASSGPCRNWSVCLHGGEGGSGRHDSQENCVRARKGAGERHFDPHPMGQVPNLASRRQLHLAAHQRLEAIFEPFYRAPQRADLDAPGFGIGLAIAKRAISLHHGTITARNVVEGGFEIAIHPLSSCRRQGPPRDQEPADHQAALEAFHRCSLLVNVGEPVFSDIDSATNFRRPVSPAASACVSDSVDRKAMAREWGGDARAPIGSLIRHVVAQ